MVPDTHTPPASLRELLHFYADAGADEALAEEAPNRFVEKTPQRIPPLRGEMPDRTERGAVPPDSQGSEAGKAIQDRRSTASPSPPGISRTNGEVSRPRHAAAIPDGAQVARARELAREARTLDELRQQLAAFDGCNLKFTAKNLVFADGNAEADLMLVGEAPGRDEDIEGLPFVGRSGQLLNRMLAAIGRDRQSAYIANVIPWRPPGNRTPTPIETEICRPFIERQIELVAPKVLVTLGNPSTKTLLNTQVGIMRIRGNWQEHRTAGGLAIPAMPTLHPAYLLRNPAAKKLAWRDFLEIKARLAN
ncbi:MAG: uracil-DNA glycosylase [Hyphomicrobiales bacterium]|nr:uracil-DNA glycosylase [Hyphomicrobiales bacterium]